jgi:hypothetical protein
MFAPTNRRVVKGLSRVFLASCALSVGVGVLGVPAANAAGACTGTLGVASTTTPYLRDPAFPGSPYKEPSTAKLAVSIPAGTYLVNAGSEDDQHVAGPGKEPEDELNERWYAVFYGADATTVVGQTPLTPDLPWADTWRTWMLADLTLTAPASFVQYFHPTGGVTRGSVAVSCLALSALAYPPTPNNGGSGTPTTTPPAPTPTPAPTPAPPAPEVPVTSAPPANADGTPPSTTIPLAAPAHAASPTENVFGVAVSFTGAQSTAMAAIAAGLVALGVVLVVAARRRRNVA